MADDDPERERLLAVERAALARCEEFRGYPASEQVAALALWTEATKQFATIAQNISRTLRSHVERSRQRRGAANLAGHGRLTASFAFFACACLISLMRASRVGRVCGN
jgi:hypothetical protein